MISPLQWPSIHPSELDLLNDTTDQIHRAAQFISMAGKKFLPHQADDSHTNLGWDLERRWFKSHLLPANPPLFLAIKLPEFRVILSNEAHEVLQQYDLKGHTMEDAFQWIGQQFSNHGLDSSSYKLDLHYELPDHELDHGGSFLTLEESAYQSFVKVRSLGALVMNEYVQKFSQATAVRTWPHHFDIGSFIPLQQDAAGGLQKSIGMGLGIHDEFVDQHYFYVSHWSKEGGISYKKLPDLPRGAYWNLNHWTGSILPLSEIIQYDTPEGQIELISAYMDQSLSYAMEWLGLS